MLDLQNPDGISIISLLFHNSCFKSSFKIQIHVCIENTLDKENVKVSIEHASSVLNPSNIHSSLNNISRLGANKC